MKKAALALLGLSCLAIGTVAFAEGSGFGGIATRMTSQLGPIAKLITAAAYVAGMAFAVGAIVKFKAHKDNPTQIPIGTPIALLFVGAALIFMPTIFKAAGGTLAEDAESAGISGIDTIGKKTG
tara:strand:- start:474 stop:845 length:372 start_codon:yes stop_codon:yes gene_type:complete